MLALTALRYIVAAAVLQGQSGAHSQKPGNPVMTWSPYYGNHAVDGTRCNAGTCVRQTTFARLTPGADITVVRVQFRSDPAPYAVTPFLGASCPGTVDVIVTDGVQTAGAIVPTGSGRSRDADSGVTSVTFSAGRTLTATYRYTFLGAGPDDFAAENCFYQAGGLTVQYTMP